MCLCVSEIHSMFSNRGCLISSEFFLPTSKEYMTHKVSEIGKG